jgi:hypothetical protein
VDEPDTGRREVALAALSLSPPEILVGAPAERGPVIDGVLDPAAVALASGVTVDVVRAPVEGYRPPVACPSSSSPRNRPVRDLSGPETRDGRLRLTARGRRVRALVVACALVVSGWIAASAIQSALSSPVIPPSAPPVVQVHQGDTLWSIAGQVAPQQDPRRVVAVLRAANHLDSNTVRPGQQLRVPR